MPKHSVVCIAASAALVVSGCATPHVVQEVKTSDNTLTCAQLDTEMSEADRFRSDAQKEKRVTGTNVAAVILFWPAMIGTYSNANEAILAADTRKSHLVGLYAQKKCMEKGQTADALTTTFRGENEQQLSELKTTLDKGLISKEEQDIKRKQVLKAVWVGRFSGNTFATDFPASDGFTLWVGKPSLHRFLAT